MQPQKIRMNMDIPTIDPIVIMVTGFNPDIFASYLLKLIIE